MDERHVFRFPAAIHGINPAGDGRNYSTVHSDGFPESALTDVEELWESFRFVRPPGQQLLGDFFAIWTCEHTPGVLVGRFTPETDQYGRLAETLVVAFIQPEQVAPKSKLASFLAQDAWLTADRDAMVRSGINLTLCRTSEWEGQLQIESLLDTDVPRTRILRSTHPHYETHASFDLIVGPRGASIIPKTRISTPTAPNPAVLRNEMTNRSYPILSIALGIALVLVSVIGIRFFLVNDALQADLSSVKQKLDEKDRTLRDEQEERKNEAIALGTELQNVNRENDRLRSENDRLIDETDRLRSSKSPEELIAADAKTLIDELDKLVHDLANYKNEIDKVIEVAKRLREQIDSE